MLTPAQLLRAAQQYSQAATTAPTPQEAARLRRIAASYWEAATK